MYFDSLSITALVDELQEKLVGGRIQDVLDVDPTGFGLEVYKRQRHYLYMSADKQVPRVHLVGDKLRRGLYKPKQLGLMFRTYVESALITAISQPAWERIIFIDVEHMVKGQVRIVIEPMERRSNILLLQDGIILDCVHRVGPEDNSYRLSLPNHEYKLPPPLDGRYNPYTLTQADLETLFNTSETPQKDKITRFLPRAILGISPLLAREIIYRATGNTETTIVSADSHAILDAMREIMLPLQSHQWQIGVAGEDESIEAFSVFPITHLPNWRRVESLSEAMTDFYGAAVGSEAYDQAKKPVQEALEEAKARYGAKLHALENSLRDQSELEHLQQSGELILAYQYAIQPNQTELVAQYDFEAPALHIKIDPELTPLENAQRYFDKYNRAKRAHGSVPELIEATQHEYNYILQLENDLKMAGNWVEIDDVIQSVQLKGFAVTKKKIQRMGGSSRSAPLKFTKDGFVIWLGRNSRQNDEVTFRLAKPDDLWFHARNVPGAHAVIRNDGRIISDELINQVAALAAFYSAKQSDTKVEVDMTRIKYVRAIKGGGLGMVTYRNERTLTVEPQNEEKLNG